MAPDLSPVIDIFPRFRQPHFPDFPVFSVAQDDGKGGLSLRGVAFMTVLAVLTVLVVLESTLPSFCLSYKIQHNEATVAVLTVWRFRS